MSRATMRRTKPWAALGSVLGLLGFAMGLIGVVGALGLGGGMSQPSWAEPALGLLIIGVVGLVLGERARAHQNIRQILTDAREALRRERILHRLATELAAPLDLPQAHVAIVQAAADGLTAAVSLIDHRSGQVVAQSDPGSASDAPLRRETLPIIGLTTELAFVIQTVDQPFQERDQKWLAELVTISRAALARAAERLQLQQAERDMRAAFEGVPAPVAVWDTNGTVRLASAAYRELDLHSPESGPTEITDLEVVVGDPARTFLATTRPLPGESGTVCVYREITREREALRAKDALIATIGHELRTPLTSIHGYSEIMARQLGIVQQQVERLNQMIADFLLAARQEGGQLPLTRTRLDLVAVVQAAAERFRGAYGNQRLQLALPTHVPIDADPTRLAQVLDNLLGNAAKYAPEGTEIRVTLHQREGAVLLAIHDQGIGIAPDHLPHLFDRFYRAPGVQTRQIEGLGLGLAIVRDLVRAHRGEVWAESPGEGQGSTFWVSLPVDDTTVRPEAEDQPSTDATGGINTGDKVDHSRP